MRAVLLVELSMISCSGSPPAAPPVTTKPPTWTVAFTDSTLSLSSVWGDADDRVFAVGAALAPEPGVVLVSRDRGASWQSLTPTSNHLAAITAHDHDLWAVGYEASIYHSSDEGVSWETQRTLHKDSSFCGVCDFDDVVRDARGALLAAGAPSSVISIDDGLSWEAAGVISGCDRLTLDDRGTVFCAGSRLYAREGDTWEIQIDDHPQRTNSDTHFTPYASARGGAHPLATGNGPEPITQVGSYARILARGDQPDAKGRWHWDTVWASDPLGTEPERLNDVWSGPDGRAVAVGRKGLLLYSNDGGVTWTRQEGITTEDLQSVWGSPSGDLYIVGAKGLILRRD